MGITDRIRNREAQARTRRGQQGEGFQTDSPSTILAVAEAGHIRRLKGVVHVLENFIRTNGDGNMARMSFFMSTIVDEMAEELDELDEKQVRLYLFEIGEVISWVGHGDNSRLPDHLIGFAEMVQPTGGDSASSPQPAGTYPAIDT